MDCPRKRRMDLVRHRSRKTGRHRQHAQRVGRRRNLETLWRIEFRRTLGRPERARRVLQQHLPAAAAKGIVEFWQKQQADGVAHITVNLKPTRRGALETIQDFAENVIPHFAV